MLKALLRPADAPAASDTSDAPPPRKSAAERLRENVANVSPASDARFERQLAAIGQCREIAADFQREKDELENTLAVLCSAMGQKWGTEKAELDEVARTATYRANNIATERNVQIHRLLTDAGLNPGEVGAWAEGRR